MKEASGSANLTVIVIVLIGVVASVGIVLVSGLMKNMSYKACCTSSGGIWTNDYCAAPTPTTCANREAVWQAYDQCAVDNGLYEANVKYRAVGCTD